ncbi:response regulator [Microtetraspora sp. AC03309]|uniref:response regulator n=1 Tax=Microtetraspora sp. AC03309 TaxID=2779376 RepID=UPI001E3D4C74|nr:response regulator [Microtetraspora sp. AC03309]MCC5576356.1 response regulator [Microtetraspora sp. AC03309]
MATRCLIIDDSDHFLVVARELLQREGFAVVGVAATAADAVLRVDEARPDVALVDIDLGQESGFDVARRLTESSHPPRIILISAYAEKDFMEMIADSPAIGFLPKSALSGTAIRELLSHPPGSLDGSTGQDRDGGSP